MAVDDGNLGDPGEDDTWSQHDERRYQARRRQEVSRLRRRRRQTTVFAVVVLLVLGVGTGAAGVYQGWWEWPTGAQDAADGVTDPGPRPCPTPTETAAQPAEVRVRVLNGTGERGLAAAAGAELQARGYVVTGIGDTASPVTEVAQVLHGPDGLRAARSIAAQVDAAVLVDDDRSGPDVDLALGAGYAGLRPLAAVTPSLAPDPAASPVGCVPVS